MEEHNYVLSLTYDSNDPQTLFELIPLYNNEETNNIELNSLVRIRHQTTKAFIKAKDDLRMLGIGHSENSSFNFWFEKLNKESKNEETKQEQSMSEEADHSESDRRSEGSHISAGGSFSHIIGKSAGIQDKFKPL